MAERSSSGTPRSFLVIGILAVLWNLMGVVSYLMEVTRTAEALAQLPEAERTLIASLPVWVTGAFAIAVWVAVLGCVGLLLKKAWAVPAFLVSLIAVVLQMSYWMFMTKAMEVYGMETVVMPLLVTVIAGFLAWYSRHAQAKGWLM